MDFMEEIKPEAVKEAERRVRKDLEALIRQIVREEIAAHKEQLSKVPEIIALSEEKRALILEGYKGAT